MQYSEIRKFHRRLAEIIMKFGILTLDGVRVGGFGHLGISF